MEKTPLAFVENYIYKAIDFDNYAGVQCVDGFRVFGQWAGIPIPPTPDNWAQGYWLYRDQLGFSKYFDYITDKADLRDGDWCIWLKGSSCALSHVAMAFRGQYFGERQDGNLFFCLANIKNDWAGALRWKGWSQGMKIGSGRTYRDTFAGQDIIVRGLKDGHQITLASAKTNGKVTGTDLQPIRDIDDDRHVFYSKLNCNFFDMSTGQALGVRCGLDEWSVPRQGSFLFYALKTDGSSVIGMDNDFWYGPEDVVFACSPAIILMHDGKDVDMTSPETFWKRDWTGTQSLLIRTAERYCFALVKGNLSADQCRAWAKSIDGIRDLCILDSGGSAQLQDGYDVYYATGEHRPLSNVLAEVVEKAAQEPAEVPPETIPKEDEDALIPPTETAPQPQNEPVHEEPADPLFEVGHESEDTTVKTISGQIAKLIDVKSIMTILVISCLCYLVVTGQPIDEKFMQIVVAIMTFYFGYQANKPKE